MARFNTRISLKYDTYTNWHAANPVLLKGELAIVEVPASTGVAQNEPTYLLKVGNGTDKFDDLKWISGHAADVYAWAKAAQKPTYQASEISGLDDYIQGQIQDTNTKYQIVKNGNLGFKLQSKELNGEDWTDVSDITLTAPVYTLEEGTENGTVKFNNTDVKVHGLGSAAYTESSAYEIAGAAAAVQGETESTIKDVEDSVAGIQAKLAGKQDTLVFNTTYNAETNKAATMTDINTAKSEAQNYTDTKITGLNIGQYATTESMNTAIGQAKTDLIGTGTGSATTIKGAIDEVKAYADQQIVAQVSSTYKAAGSVAFEALPELNAASEGKVYNITNAFTTTENFVEGAGQSHPAGTNVVCIDVGEDSFKWDVLAGMVDLSAYDTAEVAQGKIDTAKQAAIDAAALDATSKANTAEANAKRYADGLKATIDEAIELKADQNDLDTLSGRVTTVEGTVAKKADASALTALQGKVTVVEGEIDTLQGQIDSKAEQSAVDAIDGRVDAVETELANKVDDEDLATVAKTGKIDDLTQTATIVFNCGSATEIM